MTALRLILGLVGVVGFSAGTVVAFREHASAALLACSTVLILIALFAERIESVTAKVGDTEVTIPIRGLARATQELRALAAREDESDPTRAELETIVEQLEQSLVETAINTSATSIEVSTGVAVTEDPDSDKWPREIDVHGQILPRPGGGFHGLRLDLEGGAVHLTATVPRERIGQGIQFHQPLGQVPMGEYELTATLLLPEQQEAHLARLRVSTEAGQLD